jgi:hypothetical protein
MVLVYARGSGGPAGWTWRCLAVASIAVSWLSVHVIFTRLCPLLHYRPLAGGGDLSGPEPPSNQGFAALRAAATSRSDGVLPRWCAPPWRPPTN